MVKQPPHMGHRRVPARRKRGGAPADASAVRRQRPLVDTLWVGCGWHAQEPSAHRDCSAPCPTPVARVSPRPPHRRLAFAHVVTAFLGAVSLAFPIFFAHLALLGAPHASATGKRAAGSSPIWVACAAPLAPRAIAVAGGASELACWPVPPTLFTGRTPILIPPHPRPPAVPAFAVHPARRARGITGASVPRCCRSCCCL